ncbi:MAG: response regulator, partial [Syntrophobacterales bacterium]
PRWCTAHWHVLALSLLLPKSAMRVLIIEQEKTIRDSLSCFMEQQGNLDVSSAPSWRDGMSLIQTVRFDIVFCGHRLPDGNGLEMLKELARQNPKLISILMTEHKDDSLRQEALRAGIRGYLEKPFDLTQLEEIMGTDHMGSPVNSIEKGGESA